MNAKNSEKSASRFRAEIWSEEQFSQGQDDWQDLLDRSDADRLFMSWHWQYLWWDVHKKALLLELALVAVYEEERLVALLPFTLRTVSHRGLFRTRRLELLGNAWRQSDAAISEFLDIIVDRDGKADLVNWLTGFVRSNFDFDEMIAANIRRSSLVTTLMLEVKALSGRGYLRRTDEQTDFGIDVSAGFEEYVDSLVSDARRKLHAHRSRLEAPQLRYVSGEELPEAYDLMCQYLADRWERRESSGPIQEFYKRLAVRMESIGHLRFSVLTSGGTSMSLMFNLRVGRTEYNIQSAFVPGGIPGLTLTYLHFGYCIEDACEDDVGQFLLLAGRGKARDYKKDIAEPVGTVSTIQLLCGRVARSMYRGYDRLRGHASVTTDIHKQQAAESSDWPAHEARGVAHD